ncbi:hypothetical protein TNCV_2267961 [Trichonephila clavipes]|nr:hypothetical protein TNCV_2267961 [Trichonephila clavipes]
MTIKRNHLVILFISECRRSKRGFTPNISRVGSTSASPQGITEKSVVYYFERKIPFGDFVHLWVSRNEKMGSKRPSNEVTLQYK